MTTWGKRLWWLGVWAFLIGGLATSMAFLVTGGSGSIVGKAGAVTGFVGALLGLIAALFGHRDPQHDEPMAGH